MAPPAAEALFDAIRALPLWRGRIEIFPIGGGMTNRNFRVVDGGRAVVVRFGGDIPVHGIMRFNEHAASLAAAAAGVSPAVRHAGPGVLVIDHVDGETLTPAGVRARRDRCVALVRTAHDTVGLHLRGPALAFDVFHVVRDYIGTLHDAASPHRPLLARFAAIAARLQRAAGPHRPVFAHNDLLCGNFIDDGTRLWLIDWDYAGFNTNLFDLGGLSSNNGFSPDDDAAMLAAYFARDPTPALLRRFAAITCASLLRETLWSMVSEIHSAIDFDYAGYTAANLARFEAAWAAHPELQRA